MNPVTILKHVEYEGPGVFGEVLMKRGLPLATVNLWRAEELPSSDAVSALLVMGGPMAVYETAAHGFLTPELAFLKSCMDRGVPMVGVCLGSQLIAAAAGARVYRGPEEEVGWFDVEVATDGMADPVFSMLATAGDPNVRVFQLHGDTFDLPDGAVRLASSARYANQAFRVGESAYALQFHLEATKAMIAGWVEGRGDASKIAATSDEFGEAANRASALFLDAFLDRFVSKK